jgi:UDP-N-acetylmuramoyl-tripeptide--D-alanyl-D-alanine ligase
MELTVEDILKATGASLAGSSDVRCEGVCIDSRVLVPGHLFVAITGVHFDGHQFVADAAAKGASAAVVSKDVDCPDWMPVVKVKDTERALGDIASWWRSRFDVPCIAITGSNGKSTTKEMAFAVASELGEVLKTEGNFNNLIGLPLTVLRWEERHRAAILEMGMNAPGEIARLTEIARPNIGLITNVTSAHLEKLHSIEAVARAKGELFAGMGGDAVAIVNDEDPWVVKMAAAHKGKKIGYGMKNSSDVRFLHMETDGLDTTELAFSVRGKEYETRLPVPGAHNVMNALAAIAIGVALNIDPAVAAKRISSFRPMSMRFERIQLANGVRLVNDSYNANPGSMRAAFRTVGAAKRAGRFIAVLGDMLELGGDSAKLHRQLGADAVEMGVDMMMVAGNFAKDVVAGAVDAGMKPSSAAAFGDVEEIASKLLSTIGAGDVVLVKGSRGMKMERVADALKNNVGMG